MANNQSEDSSIGETCHQCCHKISGFAASCKNRRNNEPCLIKLCQKCLLDRYGEEAEQVAAFQGWLCPKCRGICNCTVCMEKKGHQPTGVLTNTKEATEFSTDIEMLKRLKRKLSEASINGDENKSENSRMNSNTKDKGNVSCVSVVSKNDKGKEKVSEFLVSWVTAEDLSEALQFLEFCSDFEKRAGRGIEQGWGDGDGYSSSPPPIKYDKDATSEMVRQNWYSEKAGPSTGSSRHSGGSHSALDHSLALQKESGRAPNAYQCFLRTHQQKDGTFVDERSRLIAAGVGARIAAARQVAGDAPIDMTKIYLEVVGRVDKQRLHGLGSQADVHIGLNSSQSDILARKRQKQEDLSMMQLVQLFAHLKDRLAAKNRKMQAQMQAKMQEMQQPVARMLEELYSQGLFPKPPRS